MVSRKINELQLQREQPERQSLPVPPRQGRALPRSLLQPHVPSCSTQLAAARSSHGCACCASPQAAHPAPQHRCTSHPSEQVWDVVGQLSQAPAGREFLAGQEQWPQQPRAEPQLQGPACPEALRWAPHCHREFLPTTAAPSAAVLCPEHK